MYLAIDIGGTKTLLAAFSAKGELKASYKFKTPVNYPDFLQELKKHLVKLPGKTYAAAAVAMPGRVSRTAGIGEAFGNLPWQDVPLRSDIKKLVNCSVVIENDANLAGLSEARRIPEYKRVLYVTISTGIGGAVITNGKIDAGLRDSEIGHMLLEHDGQLMRWEDFASGSAIVAKYGKRAGDIAPDDTSAWYAIGRNIAVGLIDAIAALTPDAIILGGGVGTHFPKYQARLVEELKIYENELLRVPPIFSAQYPEEAVIYGCYELLKERR